MGHYVVLVIFYLGVTILSAAILTRLNRVGQLLTLLTNQGVTIMSTLDDIQAEADQIKAGQAILIGKVNDQAAKIADLTAQLADAAGDQAKVDAISAELQGVVSDLNAATADAAPSA